MVDGSVSPGTPASSTTKTGRHDIAEILLKVALNTKNQSYFSNIVAVILWKAPRPVVERITLYQVYLGMTPT